MGTALNSWQVRRDPHRWFSTIFTDFRDFIVKINKSLQRFCKRFMKIVLKWGTDFRCLESQTCTDCDVRFVFWVVVYVKKSNNYRFLHCKQSIFYQNVRWFFWKIFRGRGSHVFMFKNVGKIGFRWIFCIGRMCAREEVRFRFARYFRKQSEIYFRNLSDFAPPIVRGFSEFSSSGAQIVERKMNIFSKKSWRLLK